MMKSKEKTFKPKEALVNPRLLTSKKFRVEQAKVFLITSALYCTWHASRTAWAYSKKGLKDSNPYFTDSKIGVFDMTFMLAYAFGQFYNGWLGDQCNLKNFLGIGTVISLVGYFGFALLSKSESYSMFIFVICFLLYGFGQSRVTYNNNIMFLSIRAFQVALQF
jgi:sugar phosphate permease